VTLGSNHCAPGNSPARLLLQGQARTEATDLWFGQAPWFPVRPWRAGSPRPEQPLVLFVPAGGIDPLRPTGDSPEDRPASSPRMQMSETGGSVARTTRVGGQVVAEHNGRLVAPQNLIRRDAVRLCRLAPPARAESAALNRQGRWTGPINGGLTGAASPMNTTRPSPPGFDRISGASSSQLFVSQTLPAVSMDTPVLRCNDMLT